VDEHAFSAAGGSRDDEHVAVSADHGGRCLPFNLPGEEASEQMLVLLLPGAPGEAVRARVPKRIIGSPAQELQSPIPRTDQGRRPVHFAAGVLWIGEAKGAPRRRSDVVELRGSLLVRDVIVEAAISELDPAVAAEDCGLLLEHPGIADESCLAPISGLQIEGGAEEAARVVLKKKEQLIARLEKARIAQR